MRHDALTGHPDTGSTPPPCILCRVANPEKGNGNHNKTADYEFQQSITKLTRKPLLHIGKIFLFFFLPRLHPPTGRLRRHTPTRRTPPIMHAVPHHRTAYPHTHLMPPCMTHYVRIAPHNLPIKCTACTIATPIAID